MVLVVCCDCLYCVVLCMVIVCVVLCGDDVI